MRFFKILLPIFCPLLILGCFSVPDYPNSPSIEFAKIISVPRLDQFTGGYKDSVVISVKFKDGDGDLGYEQWEIDSLRKNGDGYNYIVKQYRKNRGVYEPFTTADSQSGYFHRLFSDKPGPLEGTLHYSGVEIYHAFYPYKNDTLKFDVTIRDRAGNASNTITTDSIIVKTL